MNIGYFVIIVFSYLLGSIPFGLLLVKLISGKDIRKVESGRTGGTNAARAAGVWVGVVTAILDGLKAACTVWISRALLPGNIWLEIFAPIFAILGHNYSIFLIERDEKGRIRLRGGAGGAPCVGGSVGLWFPSVIIIIPLAFIIFFFGGYASITTLSVALLSTLVFSLSALTGQSPWIYSLYGLIAEVLLILALRANIRRLINGTERVVGWRAIRRNKDTDPD